MFHLGNNTVEAPPTTSDRFDHISSAIDDVQTILRRYSPEDFANDRHCQLALERLMEIISVACDHIPDHIKATENQVDWRTLSEMSVRLENSLERIEPDTLWNLASVTVLPLKACAVSRAAGFL